MPMYEYFDDLYGESLEHHGILGMKWGIRRFQNKDGSLTEAGKKRAEKNAAKAAAKEEKNKAKTEKKEAKAAAKEEKRVAKEEEAQKQLRAEIDDAIANINVEKLAKLKGYMTNEDLKNVSQRALALGQVGDNLAKFRKELPKSAYEKAIGTLAAVKGGLDAIKNTHASLNELRKEFGMDTKSILDSVKDNNSGNGNKKDTNDNSDKKEGKGIFDRITDFTDNLQKENNAKKFQKELKELRDRDKDNKTLDWLKSINGSDKPKTETDSGFKLKPGDYSVFKSTPSPQKESNDSFLSRLSSVGNITSVKLPDISVPAATKSTVAKMTTKSSPIGSMTVSDINKMFEGVDELNKKWTK